MKEINDLNEFAAFLQSNPLAVVDFYGTWCAPCIQTAPLFEKLPEEFANVAFVKVNVVDGEDVSEAHAVKSVPTFICFKDGTEVARQSGTDMELVKTQIRSTLLGEEIKTEATEAKTSARVKICHERLSAASIEFVTEPIDPVDECQIFVDGKLVFETGLRKFGFPGWPKDPEADKAAEAIQKALIS